MIAWKRSYIFQLLCLFGDGKEHPWLEVINLGTRLFLNVPIRNKKYKTHQAKFEAFFKKGIEYGLIEMIATPLVFKQRDKENYMISKEDFNYKLTAKGDKLLRQEQAEREGNVFYYNLFDRSVDGKFGVDAFSPLTSVNPNSKEKHTYKINKGKIDRNEE